MNNTKHDGNNTMNITWSEHKKKLMDVRADDGMPMHWIIKCFHTENYLMVFAIHVMHPFEMKGYRSSETNFMCKRNVRPRENRTHIFVLVKGWNFRWDFRVCADGSNGRSNKTLLGVGTRMKFPHKINCSLCRWTLSMDWLFETLSTTSTDQNNPNKSQRLNTGRQWRIHSETITRPLGRMKYAILNYLTLFLPATN